LFYEVITNADETDKNQARVLDIIILLLLHVNNKDRNNPRPMVHEFKKNRTGFERRFALEAVKTYKSRVLCPKLLRESLISIGQQFHQYQQNDHSSLTPNY
jgi:hypothetical protein